MMSVAPPVSSGSESPRYPEGTNGSQVRWMRVQLWTPSRGLVRWEEVRGIGRGTGELDTLDFGLWTWHERTRSNAKVRFGRSTLGVRMRQLVQRPRRCECE